MTEPTEKTTPSPERAPDAKPAATPETKRDEWLEAIESNPRFRLIKPSGAGFVIGGQHPAQRPKG